MLRLFCGKDNDGIVLISQLDAGKVTYYDYLSKLTPKIPSRKEELEQFLRERNVPFVPRSKVEELRVKAKEYIKCHQKRDGVLVCIEGVTAMTFYPRGVLRYISDGDVRSPFLGLKFAI